MKHLGERGCAEEIRNRMAQLQADDVALWGRMSAGEMVCACPGGVPDGEWVRRRSAPVKIAATGRGC